MGRWRFQAALVLWASLAGSPAFADEALARDGRRFAGSLVLAPDGRLQFTLPAGDPLPALTLVRIRTPVADAPASPPPPLRIAGGWRFLLLGGQQLTGELLGLDAQTLRLRTAWARRLELPRSAVLGVTTLPGWRPRFADEFADLKAWAVSGKPSCEGGDTPAVVFDAAGQELAYKLPEPLSAGRVGVNFQERQNPAGARWELEAVFERPGGDPQTVRVTVAGGGDHYRVAAAGMEGEAQPGARSPGWHRLVVQFTSGSLRVTCDDAVLWYTLKQGPPGPLRQVRLACRAAGTAAPRGAIAWATFGIEQAADESPRPGGDATQDEVWLDDGDQLFGKVVRADRRAVEFQGRFGARTLPWSRIHGLFFRRASPPPATTAGAHVRLELVSSLTPERDVLQGVVRSLDARELVLRHALLGKVRLDRVFVREVRPQFHGRRIELDLGFHTLRAADRPAWRGSFRLEAVPEEARLVLDVVNLAESGPRAEVVVNGRQVDYLNRQVERASRQPRRLTVALPRETLKSGENSLELHQAPEPRGERHAACGISDIVLEIPD
jgi:hypothetical protein